MIFTWEMFWAILLAAVCGYLLGSIIFAIIVTKLFARKDIRDFGSGNAGLTNVLRTLGKGPAACVLVGDFMKGVLSVIIGKLLFEHLGGAVDGSEWFMLGGYIGAFFAVLGHIFPVFHGFKGGKGILITAGVMLLLNPWVLCIILGTFIIVVVISRYVSLASISAAVMYPVATFLVEFLSQQKTVWIDTVLAAIIAALVIFMHRGNIKRLLSHTESKLGQKKKESAENTSNPQ